MDDRGSSPDRVRDFSLCHPNCLVSTVGYSRRGKSADCQNDCSLLYIAEIKNMCIYTFTIPICWLRGVVFIKHVGETEFSLSCTLLIFTFR
jgi:hypothetical protein